MTQAGLDPHELEALFSKTAITRTTENAWAMERLSDPGFGLQNTSFVKSVCGIIVQAMAQFIAIKNPEVYHHSQRVMDLACAGARELGLEQGEIDAIRYAGILHDLGKIYIPQCILQSATPLTDDQKWIIRMHPGIGSGALAGIPFLRTASEIVLHHHENYDGTGYPRSVRGDQIPLGARILSIADSFEAMTTERPYRQEPLTPEQAINELEANAGTQFDASLLPAMCRVLLYESDSAPA